MNKLAKMELPEFEAFKPNFQSDKENFSLDNFFRFFSFSLQKKRQNEEIVLVLFFGAVPGKERAVAAQ